MDNCSLMRQVYLEYMERMEEADLIFRFRMPEEKIVLRLDSQKTCRIFENLYINIIKYAMPDTRVYVGAEKTDDGIRIELKNMSAKELSMDPKELTERFLPGDSSRNTEATDWGWGHRQKLYRAPGRPHDGRNRRRPVQGHAGMANIIMLP